MCGMEKHRIKELRDKEKLTFSRSQAYLILGCILAIAVLAFSLGHLITRESDEDAQKLAAQGPTIRNPAIPEADVLDEMNRLEKRLVQAEKSIEKEAGEEKPAQPEPLPIPETEKKKEETIKVQVVEIPVPEKTEKKKTEKPEPKFKKIDRIKEKKASVKINKEVNVTADKTPIAQTQAKVERREKAKIPLTTETVIEPVVPPEPVPAEIDPLKETQAQPPATKPVMVINPKYTIQVASFPSEKDAERLMGRLNKRGYRAYIYKKKRPRSVWYQVLVGAFEYIGNAEKMAERLKRKENLEGKIEKYRKR